MKHIKVPTLTIVLAGLVLCGIISVVAGVYLLWGLAVALIVGGAAAVATGLLVDV